MSLNRTFSRGLLVAVWLSASACLNKAGEARPSHVAQGLTFTSGNRAYDDFFARVHELQVVMLHADQELANARRRLSPPSPPAKAPSASALASRVKGELDRLNARGVPVRVELKRSPAANLEATRAVFAPASKPGGADAKLVQELEYGVTGMLRVSSATRSTRDVLPQLCAKALELESKLDADFPDRIGSRRAEVLLNLRDAERVLALLIARADETGKPADDFVSELSVALGKEPRSVPRAVDNLAAAPRVSTPEPAPASPAAQPAANKSAAAAEKTAAQKTATGAEPVTRSAFEP